ncbi:MAG: hypothetical protein ACXWYF_04505 [Actinomycetota bacterium]
MRVIDVDERRLVARRALVPSLLALMLLAACGGESAVDPQPPAVGTAFANRAVAVCQAALARKKAQGPFPYPDFNPTQPDASKLPEIARFLTETVETFETWLDEMQALGQPSSGEAAWDDLLAAIERHVRLDVEQQAAAERGDTETFTRDYHEGVETQVELLRAAEATGVPGCADVDR